VSKKTKQLRAERAAAALREQERREKRRRMLVVGAVLLAIVLLVVVGFLINRARDTSDEVNAEPAGVGEHGVTIGDPEAPHDIVIYEDFLCPYCGQLEAHSQEELAQLAEDGQVYVEYRPFEVLGHLGDYSQRSTAAFAVLLETSGPEVAKRFHDLLFENQPPESGPFPDDSELVDLAVEAGAEESEVAEDIENGAGNGWVERATQAASDAGVRGTPTVLLDGEVFNDGRTMEELAENLVAAVGG